MSALVDAGATFMCVSEEIALQLGFDITEVSRQVVTLADGHQRKVPKIAPIEIAFGNRTYVTRTDDSEDMKKLKNDLLRTGKWGAALTHTWNGVNRE